MKGVQRYKQDENPPNFFTLFVVKFLVGTLGTGWDGLGTGGLKQGIDREGRGYRPGAGFAQLYDRGQAGP